MSKWPALDLLKIKAHWGHADWKTCLKKCVHEMDLHKIGTIRYGLQRGMTELAKKKINDEKTCEFFAMLQRQTEEAARWVIRKRHENNPYVSQNVANNLEATRLNILFARADKKQMEVDFQSWKHKYSY